jgi:3-oxoacyl-[acyl-carrier protein] reductase
MAQRGGRMAGKVALVTGGARGIGLATARLLAEEGARVAIGDLGDTQAAVEQVRAAGGDALGVRLDVTDAASAEAAVARTIEHFGGLDVLVNNAGVARQGSLFELSEADWDLVMDVNVKGVFLCSRAAARHLPRGGAIVNVASLAGRSSSPAMACVYSASKAAVLGLTRHLARELGPRGIRVCAVNPGAVRTDMAANIADPGVLERAMANTPLGRMIEPEEVAATIVFLASDAASMVTGASLDVNGGIFMA